MYRHLGKVVTIAVASVIGSVAPAMAQSVDGPFSGPYVGFDLGLSNGKVNGGADKFGETDVKYGGFLGYRRQQESGLVLGAEAYLQDSKVGGVTGVVFATPPANSALLSANLGRTWGVDALAGVSLFDDQALLFVRGGYANQRLSGVRTGVNPDPLITTPVSVAYAFNKGGYRLGAGLEIAILPNLNWRIDASYTDTGPVQQKDLLTGAVVHF